MSILGEVMLSKCQNQSLGTRGDRTYFENLKLRYFSFLWSTIQIKGYYRKYKLTSTVESNFL